MLPHLKKRLLEECPQYANDIKRKKTSKQKEKYDWAIANTVEKLTQIVSPAAIHAKPDPKTLHKLRDAIHHGFFGKIGRRQTVGPLLRNLSWAGIHSCFVNVFFEKPQLTAEESVIHRTVNRMLARQYHYRRDEFLSLVFNFRKLRRANALVGGATTMTVQDAAKFCITKGTIAKVRILFLRACGFDKPGLEEQINTYCQQSLVFSERVKKFTSKANVYTDQWLAFVDSVDPALPNHNAKDVERALLKVRIGRKFVRAVFCDIIRQQQPVLAQMLTHKTAREKLVGLSEWHQKLYEGFIVTQKAVARTSFPERYLARTCSAFCKFVLDLDAYSNTRKKLSLAEFLRLATTQDLTEALRFLASKRQLCNERVKSTQHRHSALPHVTSFLNFLRGSMRSYISCDVDALKVKHILSGVINARKPATLHKRRTFTQQEIDAMHNVALTPLENLLIALLQEVALRNSALCYLRYLDLLTEHHQIRSVCSVMEKGARVRSFLVSESLCARIRAASFFWREKRGDDVKDVFIFNVNKNAPLPACQLAQTLARLGRDARIPITVHAHAFRHTLVGRLMEVGNSLEVVSKYLGHASANTTNQFYWIPTPEELGQQIKNPFQAPAAQELEKAETSDILLEAANEKIRACRAVIDKLLASDSARRLEIPNLQRIIECVDTPLT
jgi:integrase